MTCSGVDGGIDVGRCCCAGGYKSRCWTARLEGGGRATRSVAVATEDDDDGLDLPPPPARRQWMRRCRCPLRPTRTETTKTRARDDATQREGGGATARDERGWWTTQGKRVESDEGATRWRRTAMEVRGEDAACREVSIRNQVEQVLSKFSGALQEILVCLTAMVFRERPLFYKLLW